MVFNKRILLSLVAASMVCGCDYDPQAMNAKISAIDSRVTKLEVSTWTAKPTTPVAPTVPTVLWVQNPGAYPLASAYYSSKEECARAAAQWGFPDDKSAKQVGIDPWVTQTNKRDQFGQISTLRISCLPQGVQPFERH